MELAMPLPSGRDGLDVVVKPQDCFGLLPDGISVIPMSSNMLRSYPRQGYHIRLLRFVCLRHRLRERNDMNRLVLQESICDEGCLRIGT